jgi:regulator of replication initiation timing
MVGDIGNMREDNARLRAENARLQKQVSNISVDEDGDSPEARMFEHAQFVETMMELRRFEYDMRLAAEQRLDMIAEEMKSAKEGIASLRAQLRDAENDARDLDA